MKQRVTNGTTPRRGRTPTRSALALLASLVLSIGLAQPQGEVVAEGLNGPMGVLVEDDGTIWVVDSGTGGDEVREMFTPQTGEVGEVRFGETARVVRVTDDGQEVVATLPSMQAGMETTGGARLAMVGDRVFVTSGVWVEFGGPEAMEGMGTVVELTGGEKREVADTWAFERENNPDGFILESHPYDIAEGPDGALLVADAGANTLLRVDPDSGEVTELTTFAGVESPLPNPARGDAMESDPVPTGIALGADGEMYVSLLPGFPFLPGSAKVVRVAGDGTVEDHATGLSMLTDLTAGPDGALYAIRLANWTEQGPTPASGALIRVNDDGSHEEVLSGLMFPSSVAFDADGNAYLTVNTLAPPGAGQVLRFAGIAGGR